MKNFHLATAISVLVLTAISYSKDNVDAESQVENLTKNGVDTNFLPNSIYSEASGIFITTK